MSTSESGFDPSRVLNDGNDAGIGRLTEHLGIAQAIAGLLAAFPLHAARRQLYMPLEVLQRHGVDAEAVFSGRTKTELRAALADMRRLARRHLSEAKSLLAAAPPAVLPALLPAGLICPMLDRMEGRGYDPFRPVALAPWRRPWIIWRTARKGLERVL